MSATPSAPSSPVQPLPSTPLLPMLSSDMSWHHPVSSDRQLDDQYHQHHHQQQHQQPHQQAQPPHADWDIFASPVEFEHINSLNVTVPAIPTREPSYDLFNTAPSTFGPPGRFRSDSSASSTNNNAYAPPNASPTTASSYDYLYSQNPTVSSPSSAHSTRPSSASFSYPPPTTIAPDAVGPPSFAELMIDRSSSSGASSSTAADFSPFAAYQQPQQQQQPRFQVAQYDLASPPQQYIQRPGLRHSAQSMPAAAYSGGASSSSFASGGAFDPSATLAASAPLVKREDVPFSFVPGASYSNNPSSGLQHDGNDLQSFIRPYLERYINAPNRSAAGECSVIVMSSKVAQKSYGTEKRFLCPPPSAVFLGNNWWHETRRGDTVPPKTVISISGEPSPLESVTEWSTPLGKNFDVADPPQPSSTTYMGRCIGKQLFITDYDDRKKKVEALVRVVQPADEQDGEPERLLGVFPSKPIKVISKPSKKRQSAKNLELCINHGSTVSLFHRLRSQTVSTKYLCVSGSAAAYKGSDGQALPGVDRSRQTAPPSFIAKTACWDSFVIYIVDVNKTTGPDTVPPAPPHPDYPSPPPNAIPYNTNGAHMYTPIYYNQTVVLQCLISGVVSPVLIIRKVDRATVVVGGGLQDGVKGVPNHYCAPGEVCGDPVSQLHKIALEVYEPAKAGSAATMDPNHPGTSGSFLSCMGERVNTYRPSEDRQWNGSGHGNGNGGHSSSGSTHSPSLPGSPIASPSDYFGNPLTGGANSSASTPGMDYPPSSDGGRVRPSRQQKRASLNSGGSKVTSKGRRRVNSSNSRNNSNNVASEQAMTSGALWSVDIGETAVWTVVGTDQVRYDFYIPPQQFPGSAPTGYPPPIPSSSSALASSPSVLAQPITPAPSVVKYLPPERAQELPKCPSNQPRGSAASSSAMKVDAGAASKMLTIYGENFNKGDPVTVWFGSEPSPHTEVRCTEVINCLPPGGPGAYQRPIVLVRGDGVVFPTKVMYP